MKLDLLLDTPDFVAINKPSGLATIPGRAEQSSALQILGKQLDLASSGPAEYRLRIVHRLDKGTSGALLVAKHAAAQRHLCGQFQRNQVSKQYLALVRGRPSQMQGSVNQPLGPHPTSRLRRAIVSHGGRPALTLWTVEEIFRDFSLLRVFPMTGKTHQIRVHLQSVGLPLAIDPLYNASRTSEPAGICLSSFKRGYRSAGPTERPLIDRLTLHAHRLQFRTLANELIEVEAPIPKDFRAALNMLRKYSSR